MPNERSLAAPPALRLLVSVVAPDEVAAAIAGGADIVDVKNPAEGSLGAPSPALLRAVRAQVTLPVQVSVALGDAPHLPGTLALAAAGAAACGADYLKVGLFGSSSPEQALELLTAVRRAAAEVNPQRAWWPWPTRTPHAWGRFRRTSCRPSRRRPAFMA